LGAAKLLIDKSILHGAFFLHLVIEKALKANICKQTKDYPPKSTDLLALAKTASASLTDEQEDLFSKLNAYHLKTFYPNESDDTVFQKDAKEIFDETKVLYDWLIKRSTP